MDLTAYLKDCNPGTSKTTRVSYLSDGRLRVILFQEALGRKLAEDHPEIIDLYKDLDHFLTVDGIGAVYFGSNYSSGVRRHAVAYAVKQLIPNPELYELRLQRKRKSLELRSDYFNSPEFKELCRAAAIKKNTEIGTNIEAMIKGRGRTPWSDDEKDFLFMLVSNKEYQIQSGYNKGRPNYNLIALELNIQFHEGEEIRFAKRVGNYVRDMRRQKKLTNF